MEARYICLMRFYNTSIFCAQKSGQLDEKWQKALRTPCLSSIKCFFSNISFSWAEDISKQDQLWLEFLFLQELCHHWSEIDLTLMDFSIVHKWGLRYPNFDDLSSYTHTHIHTKKSPRNYISLQFSQFYKRFFYPWPNKI